MLLVFDEIATGFGRTGALFAAEHAAVSPDVMCVGKALTGGYLTMAATLCTSRVAEGISRGEVPVLAHGPTFMGNPLAAAVACASVELLLGQDWRTEVKRIESGSARAGRGGRAARRAGRPRAGGDRGGPAGPRRRHGRGDPGGRAEGVWLRPFRDLVYTMPPYVTGDADVARITRAVRGGEGG